MKREAGIPAISVVIPLYNKGPYIRRTLTSVLAQTFQDFTVLVVDDGSTDEGPEAVQSLRDSRIAYLRQNNQGPGAARNTGLARVQSPFVAFLDADDEWSPEFLAITHDLITRNEVAAVSMGFCMSPQNRRSTEKYSLPQGVYSCSASDSVEKMITLWVFISPCTTLIKTEVVKKYGGYYDKNHICHGEDGHFQLKLLMNEKVYIYNEPLVTIHSECSDLHIVYKQDQPLPLPAYLVDPEDVISFTPPEKGNLIHRVLARLALDHAWHNAFRGQGAQARHLLQRFPLATSFPQKYYSTRLIAGLSPLMPRVRKAYWWWKGLTF